MVVGGVGASNELKVGDRVKFKMRLTGSDTPGRVRFVGMDHETGNPRVGVELDKAIGKNDGTVRGNKYFSCRPKHGILTRPSRVSLLLPAGAAAMASGTLHQPTGSTSDPAVGTADSSYEEITTLAMLGRPTATVTTSDPADDSYEEPVPLAIQAGFGFDPKPADSSYENPVPLALATQHHIPPVVVGGVGASNELKVGDRVKFKMRLTGSDTPGRVRFVGMDHETGNPRVGVELDKAIGKNDGTVRGNKYFSCRPKHGILTRPSRVSLLLPAGAAAMASGTLHQPTGSTSDPAVGTADSSYEEITTLAMLGRPTATVTTSDPADDSYEEPVPLAIQVGFGFDPDPADSIYENPVPLAMQAGFGFDPNPADSSYENPVPLAMQERPYAVIGNPAAAMGDPVYNEIQMYSQAPGAGSGSSSSYVALNGDQQAYASASSQADTYVSLQGKHRTYNSNSAA